MDLFLIRHTGVAMSTQVPLTCCLNLLPARGNQSEERWHKGLVSSEAQFKIRISLNCSYIFFKAKGSELDLHLAAAADCSRPQIFCQGTLGHVHHGPQNTGEPGQAEMAAQKHKHSLLLKKKKKKKKVETMITFKNKSTQMTYIIPEIQQQTRSVQDKSSLIFNEKHRKALK